MWDYQTYKRETNHLMLDFTYEESDIPGSTYTEHVSTYFDRQTGALVQLEDIHTYHNPDITLTVTWELVSQNAWNWPRDKPSSNVTSDHRNSCRRVSRSYSWRHWCTEKKRSNRRECPSRESWRQILVNAHSSQSATPLKSTRFFRK